MSSSATSAASAAAASADDDMVQVSFVTKNAKIRVTDAPIAVPMRLTRYGISTRGGWLVVVVGCWWWLLVVFVGAAAPLSRGFGLC
jgi:hypothetical protein